jgi:hypothetical protein
MDIEKVNKFVFSPSSLVEFENSSTCMHRWYRAWITRDIVRPTSVMQRLGQYFEYLCLGESPFVGEVEVPQLLKNSNKKSALVKRAEEQAEVFHELFNPTSKRFIGRRIIDRHIKLDSQDPKGPKKRGIIDFVTEDVETGKVFVTDLKLTTDLESNFALTPWNKPGEIDPIQLGTYKDLYFQKYGKYPSTDYLVFELNPKKGVEHIELHIGGGALSEINDRYAHAYRRFEAYKEEQFEIYRASNLTCKNCPLINTCEDKLQYDLWANRNDCEL